MSVTVQGRSTTGFSTCSCACPRRWRRSRRGCGRSCSSTSRADASKWPSPCSRGWRQPAVRDRRQRGGPRRPVGRARAGARARPRRRRADAGRPAALPAGDQRHGAQETSRPTRPCSAGGRSGARRRRSTDSIACASSEGAHLRGRSRRPARRSSATCSIAPRRRPQRRRRRAARAARRAGQGTARRSGRRRGARSRRRSSASPTGRTSPRRRSASAAISSTGARSSDGPEPCGRKLDFLLQEMNREVNTLGSKAEGAGVTEIVVALKAELERMREQVQNVE